MPEAIHAHPHICQPETEKFSTKVLLYSWLPQTTILSLVGVPGKKKKKKTSEKKGCVIKIYWESQGEICEGLWKTGLDRERC